MAALPVYHVEFIPLERRLGDRRAVQAAARPKLKTDRRLVTGRRSEDRLRARFKVV